MKCPAARAALPVSRAWPLWGDGKGCSFSQNRPANAERSCRSDFPENLSQKQMVFRAQGKRFFFFARPGARPLRLKKWSYDDEIKTVKCKMTFPTQTLPRMRYCLLEFRNKIKICKSTFEKVTWYEKCIVLLQFLCYSTIFKPKLIRIWLAGLRPSTLARSSAPKKFPQHHR